MLRVHVQRETIDRLQQPNEEIRDLVVRKLNSSSVIHKYIRDHPKSHSEWPVGDAARTDWRTC